MRIIKSIKEMKKLSLDNRSLGFVPTLGGLHDGHLHLVRASLKKCDKTVVSIFLNPTQFNDELDLMTYPANLDEDIKKLESLGVDFLFTPQKDDIYPDGYKFKVEELEDSKILEGEKRPGHFDGVLTIVMKLLNIVSPKIAFFGKKDFQQYTLIKKMSQDFFMDCEIVALDTIREESGLAMSSRNEKLDPRARENAAKFYQALKKKNSCEEIKQELKGYGFDVEYVEDWNGRRLGAINYEGVRLIDNVSI